MALRTPGQRDPLFTEIFFSPVIPIVNAQLAFNIPQSQATLTEYFKKNQLAYKNGVEDLVEKLKRLAEEQHIFDDRAETSLSIFLQKFNFSNDPTATYIARAFPLFSQGITMLAEIISIIEKETEWTETRKTRIKHLLHNMNVCEPEVYTLICDTALALSNDCLTELMSIRREVAQQIADTVVNQYDEKLGGTVEIKIGTGPHVMYSILNFYHKKLGIPYFDDEDSKLYVSTMAMNETFIEKFTDEFNAQALIENILLRHQAQLKKTTLDADFINWLDNYGLDSKFKPEQLAVYNDNNDVDELKPHIEYHLVQTLLFRLHNNGLLNINHLKEHRVDKHSGIKFHIPIENNIKLAYANIENKHTEPFILFYLQQFLTDAQKSSTLAEPLEALCSASQQKELYEEIRKIILANWPEWVATLSADEIQKIMIHFNKKYPDDNQASSSMTNTISLFNIVVAILKPVDRFTIANSQLILNILLNENHDNEVIPLLKILNTLSENKQDLTQLIDDLLAANKNAAKLAKAIGLAIGAEIFDDSVIAFFKKNVQHADDLAQLLILFNKELKVDINESLFIFLEANTTSAHDFIACIRDKNKRSWLNYLIDQKVLDNTRMRHLFIHAKHINLIIGTFSYLYNPDNTLLADNIDLLIKHAGRVDLLNFTREVADRCIKNKITFTDNWLTTIIRYPDTYQPITDEVILAFYAAMLGLTELLSHLITSGTVAISQKSTSGSGASLLAIAILYAPQETINMLIENGASLDDPIKLKIYVLEGALADNKQQELNLFLKTKLGDQPFDSDSTITITAKEIVQLMRVKEFSAEHALTHGVFAQTNTDIQPEPAKPENTVGMDKSQ